MKILILDNTKMHGCVPGRYPHTKEDIREHAVLFEIFYGNKFEIIYNCWSNPADLVLDRAKYFKRLEPLKKEGAPFSTFGGLMGVVGLKDWKAGISDEEDALDFIQMHGFSREKYVIWQVAVNKIYEECLISYDLVVMAGYRETDMAYYKKIFSPLCKTFVWKEDVKDWVETLTEAGVTLD